MIILLCEDADVDMVDRHGNTPLYYAIVQADITLAQALIVFDTDIDHRNKGQSLRHIAANLVSSTDDENDRNKFKMMLYIIAAIGGKRCEKGQDGCKEGCSAEGSFEGKRYSLWPIFEDKDFYKNPELKEVVKEKRQKLHARGRLAPSDNGKVNLLSFDGGGIKGLITITMVRELEKRLKVKTLGDLGKISLLKLF